MSSTNLRSRYVTEDLTTASPAALLLRLYARLERDLTDATAAMAARDLGAAHVALTHAQAILEELHGSLQPERWEPARRLGDLYLYLERLLVQANVRKDPRLVEECRQIVAPLHAAWSAAANGTGAAASTQ